MAWIGFTDEDLAQMRSQVSDDNLSGNEITSDLNESISKLAFTKKRTTTRTSRAANVTGSQSLEQVPKEAFLSTTTKSNASPTHAVVKITDDTSYEVVATKNEPPVVQSLPENPYPTSNELAPSDSSKSLTASVYTFNSDPSGRKIDLDEFEKRQKLIEEQNRIKKQMLAKALLIKKQKTAAEAKKLQLIQEELNKLDALLMSDVFILREQIEVASTELSEAQKRFNKAEKEFIEAKKQLFTKQERKDMLTEHLCTIIEQNELRKAHRLTELMIQLEAEGQVYEAAAAQVFDGLDATGGVVPQTVNGNLV